MNGHSNGASRAQELATLQRRQQEIREALDAGRRAEALLAQVREDLDSARSWGTWDMLGGGLIATMVKHDRLDSARAHIQDTRQALLAFHAGLVGVEDLSLPDLEIGDFATFADYFFDGLFTDWCVQSTIQAGREQVAQVSQRLTQALEALAGQEQALTARRAALEAGED